MSENKHKQSKKLKSGIAFFGFVFVSCFFLFFLSVLSVACSGLSYRRPHISYQRDTTDMPDLLEPLRDIPEKTKSPETRRLWLKELDKVQREVPRESMEYNMYVAHCLGNLDEHEKSADYYLKAAKKTRDPKLKRKFRIAAVQALGKAGLAAEQAGDLEQAIRLYKKCNKYCHRFGFELHVPHERMRSLSEKQGGK